MGPAPIVLVLCVVYPKVQLCQYSSTYSSTQYVGPAPIVFSTLCGVPKSTAIPVLEYVHVYSSTYSVLVRVSRRIRASRTSEDGDSYSLVGEYQRVGRSLHVGKQRARWRLTARWPVLCSLAAARTLAADGALAGLLHVGSWSPPQGRRCCDRSSVVS